MDGVHIHVTTHANTCTNTNIMNLIFDDTLVIQLLMLSKDVGLEYYFDKQIYIYIV